MTVATPCQQEPVGPEGFGVTERHRNPHHAGISLRRKLPQQSAVCNHLSKL